MASSPVLADGVLVCLIENDSESFALGVDTATGTNLWKEPRPKRANWSTPVVFDRPDGAGQLVALQGSAGVDAVEPKSGKAIWSYSEGASTTPSSALADGVLYVPSHGLTALVPGAGGGFNVKWQQSNLGPGTASPVATGDRVYVISNAGVLTAADAANGERIRPDPPGDCSAARRCSPAISSSRPANAMASSNSSTSEARKGRSSERSNSAR